MEQNKKLTNKHNLIFVLYSDHHFKGWTTVYLIVPSISLLCIKDTNSTGRLYYFSILFYSHFLESRLFDFGFFCYLWGGVVAHCPNFEKFQSIMMDGHTHANS